MRADLVGGAYDGLTVYLEVDAEPPSLVVNFDNGPRQYDLFGSSPERAIYIAPGHKVHGRN
jgi:hypothetical protein